MSRGRIVVSLLVILGLLPAYGQDSLIVAKETPTLEAAVEQAAIEEGLLPPLGRLHLSFDSMLAQAEPKAERSIQDEISIDLINLDALGQAIQSRGGLEPLRLTLDECIQMALRQNQDIIISGLEPRKSDADITTARGEFDPIWQTSFNYTQSSQSANQQIAVFGGIKSFDTYQSTVQSSIGGKLYTGTQYAMIMDLTKEESTFGRFVEEFSTRLTLTLTQPLLRGFSPKANTMRIRAAKNVRKISEAQLRLQVLNTVANVVKAYWDLVGAVETLKVRQESLANAERLLKINETRREIGTAADIEVLQAKAGVAMRQSDLIAARSQTEAASDLIKQLLDLRDGDRFSKLQIVPVDRPQVEDTTLLDPAAFEERLDASVELALKNRPEIEMSELQIQNAELDAFRTRNDMMPQFDINGSYSTGGRNHYLSRSFYGLRDRQDESYSYGFQATIPLINRAARGAYTRAKLSRREAELRKKQTEQGLMLNVHMALRNVLTNQILVESNRQARRLQEAQVVAEEKRLRLGVTTSWQVLKVQEDLTAAQTMEVQAQNAYEKALIELRLAEGTLLESLEIDFETPDREKPANYLNTFVPQWPF